MNKKIPLYRQVYEELRKDIMEGNYQPGEYLPPIREEAKRLGVARNTIENAYLMLAEEGYIQAKRGQGSRISDAWRSLYFGEDVSGEKAEELSYLNSAVQPRLRQQRKHRRRQRRKRRISPWRTEPE